MRKIVKLGFPLIVAVILIMSFVSARSMSDIENYGKLINYVGIVRGASQRVIKLETNDMPNDNLINYVSSIMDELLTGEGEYGLERTGYGAFNDNLEKLGERWEQIKTEIAEVRSGHDKGTLLKSSEELFDIANETVFSIEKYSGMRSASLSRQLIVMGVFCLLISIIIVGYYVREYFRLRKRTETLADMAGRDKLTGALTTERFYVDAQKVLDSTDARIAIPLY